MTRRSIIVKSAITVEEFIAAQHVCEALGVSMSKLLERGLQIELERFHASNLTQADMFINGGDLEVALSMQAKGAA